MKKMLIAVLFGVSTIAQAVMYEGVDVGNNPILVRKADNGVAVISKELCALRGVPLARSVLLTVKTNEGAVRFCISDFSGEAKAYFEQDGKIMVANFSFEGYTPFEDANKQKQLTY